MASVLNMMNQAALIAADRSLGTSTYAAQVATAYVAQCRQQVFVWSRTHPEQQGSSAQFLDEVGNKYKERDETCFNKAKDLVNSCYAEAKRVSVQSNTSQGSGSNTVCT